MKIGEEVAALQARVKNLEGIRARLEKEPDTLSKAALEAVEDKIQELGRELTALWVVFPSWF